MGSVFVVMDRRSVFSCAMTYETPTEDQERNKSKILFRRINFNILVYIWMSIFTYIFKVIEFVYQWKWYEDNDVEIRLWQGVLSICFSMSYRWKIIPTLHFLSHYLILLLVNRANFLTSRELPKTAESLITQPNAANEGVRTREFVIPYNSPAAMDIVTTLYVNDIAKFCFIFFIVYLDNFKV